MSWPYHVQRENTDIRLTAAYAPRRPQAQEEDERDMRVDIRLIVSTFSSVEAAMTRSPPGRIEESSLVEYVLAETFDDHVHTMVRYAIGESSGVTPEVVEFLSEEITSFALRSIESEFIQQGDYSCKVVAEIDVQEWLVDETTLQPDLGDDFAFGAVPASREAMAAVKVTTYAGADEHGTICTVCMDDFEAGEELGVMPCKHTFHENCLDAWLKLSRVCPLCRFAIVAPRPPPEGQQ